MSNVVSNIGHGLKVGVEDVGKVIAYPFTHTAHFVAVLATIMKESTPVKDAVIALVKSAESVDADVVMAISEKGLNLPEDMKSLADVKAFFELFKTQFLPVVESAYKELKADVK